MSIRERQSRKKAQKQLAAAEIARRWAEWRHANADTLALLRIPEVYLKCEPYWRDFLCHGCLHFHTDSDEDAAARAYAHDLRGLSPEQAHAFFELIKDDYPGDGWSNVDYVIHTVYRVLKPTG